MKSKLTFLAALMAALFFVSSAAFASGTRMSSMGLTGVEPMIQKDSAQWGWNPATIALFPQLITVYWNGTSNTHGGGQMILKPISNVDFYTRISADYTSDAFKGVDSSNNPAWNNLWNFGAKNDYDLSGYVSGVTNAGLTNDLLLDGAVNGAYLYDPTALVGTGTDGMPLFFYQNLPTADISQNPLVSIPATLLAAAGQMSAALSPAIAAKNIGGSVPPKMAVMMATLTMAYKVNNMAFGLEGSFACTEQDSDSNLEWKVKLGTQIGITSTMSIDAAFSFGMPMMEAIGKTKTAVLTGTPYAMTNVNKYTYETDGAYDLYAYARFNWQLAETQNLHIFVKYSGADHSTYYKDDLGTNLDFIRGQHKLQIGVSDEMNFSKSSLVYVGLNLIMDMQKYYYDGTFGGSINAMKLSGDTTSWYLSLNMGAEGKIIGGLTGRLGVVHDIMVHDVDNKAETSATGSTSNSGYASYGYNYRTNASIGLAYQIGQFILEGEINKALFTDGPNFISGNVNDLSGSITLIYLFGETAAAPAATNEEK